MANKKTNNYSINVKKVLITFFCFLSHTLFATDTVTCRGNYFLDIASSAAKRDILYCFIDSDAANGFELRFDFTNGQMQNAGASTTKDYSHIYVQVPSTAELATGLSLAAEVEIGIDSVKSGSDFILRTTGTVTSGTTTGLLVKIVASWTKENILLAGFYKENVSVSISALP